ncbi:MAG: DUF3429 domain-containing protein [Sphingomonadales bacterium]|jgi:hypothetical protein
MNTNIPRIVLGWGLLGLLPFLAPPLIGLLAPALRDLAAASAALYAAIILSFLGGARWGAEVRAGAADARTLSIAMLPSVAAWAELLIWPPGHPAGLAALAGGLALVFVWDAGASGLPAWYPRLRALLSAGAIAGLAAMAWQVALA